MTELHIQNPNEYYTAFSNAILENHTHLVDNQYAFNTPCGEGHIEHVTMEDGLEIVIHNMVLNKHVEYQYALNFSNFEIIHCIEGSVLWGDASSQTEIKTGDYQLLKNQPCKRWEKYAQGCWKSISICFDKAFLNRFTSFCIDTMEEKNIDSRINGLMLKIISPEIKVVFNQIAQCISPLNSSYRLLYMKSKAMEIISLFLQDQFLQCNQSKKSIYLTKEDKQKLQDVKKVLNKHYVQPLSIQELSKYIGLNTFKLKAGFKEVYHTTIFGYIRDMRMEKAREYLVKGHRNVIDIANLVGYSNPSHFSVAFKKKFGVNPSELKKQEC